MANDIKLQEGHPVDENLRPLKVGGKTTAIETAQHGNGARVNGDLEITGAIPVVPTNSIRTVTDTALHISSHRAIELFSDSGSFMMMTPQGEFSPSGSAYAGMILGYTVIGLNETPAKFDVTNAMLPVHNDLKVSFVFPPSGKVEIMASIYVQTDSPRFLTFGLSTTDADAGFTSLGAKYENNTFSPTDADGEQHTHRWYIHGIPGDSEALWFAAGATVTNRFDLYWGGDSSSLTDGIHPAEYQPFVMKATALPATIYTG